MNIVQGIRWEEKAIERQVSNCNERLFHIRALYNNVISSQFFKILCCVYELRLSTYL